MLVLACVFLATAAACGDSDSPGAEDIPVGGRVAVDEDGITPRAVTITAGEIVEFTNEGDEDHRLIAKDRVFDTGDMRPGETFAFLAEEPGRITYRDDNGPGEATGAVVVEPAEGSEE